MPDITNEEKNEFVEKVAYIGLDFDNIPECLKNIKIDFRPERTLSNEKFKIYKYISIDEIEIILSKSNRMDSIQKKFENASPLYNYITAESEDDILKHAKFLNMIEEVNLDGIKNIGKEQILLSEKEPFLVKFEKDYLWEIYYSSIYNKYFMLVTTEDKEYEAFFYILKEKIKNRNRKIYVPISGMDYSRELLGRDDFKDLEKYIWQFTKEWPMIYEVYDKNENVSVQICGKSVVYGKIESIYKVRLSNRDEATKFFKLIKALFILNTEFPHDYIFDIQISSQGGIDFLFNSKILTYDGLVQFIKEEYRKKSETLRIIKKEEKILKDVLENLKKLEVEREKEYLLKQNQVATYLECRKTFFGKVKYFFKGKIKQEIFKTDIPEAKIEIDENDKKQEYERDFYTLEDLINLCRELNNTLSSVKNIRMDKRALEIKNNQLKAKINNATKFIKEIDNHKKSIFEFWKFANKDNQLVLEAGYAEQESEKEEEIHEEEIFDYIDDKEEIGIRIDDRQRKILSKEETDIIYLVRSKLLNNVNAIKKNVKYNFSADLEILKNDLKSLELLFGTDYYDIFGNSVEDKTKIGTLGNKKHREKKKDEYRIIDINDETDTIEFVSKLHGIILTLDKIYEKCNLGMSLNVYKTSENLLETQEYTIFDINPNNALMKKKNESRINLYSIHLKTDTPAIGISNIICYDNLNKTLPVGMDVSDEVMLDMSKIKLELKRQKLFRMNVIEDQYNIKTKTVCVYEYECNN
jgi:hypothetical protein